jgi:electron transfer flavoprotein beta subunit
MRIVVCVKQVYDPATVRISRSREEFDLRGAKRITSLADRFALEAGLRLREALGGEVIAVTVGDEPADDTAHEAVAIGADRAMLILGPQLAASGRMVVRALAAAVERLAPVDLVLTGAIDPVNGTGSLAGRLAAQLGWPVVLDALRLAPAADGLEALVSYDGEGRLISLSGPAVVSVRSGPQRPRYAHAARIANAWQSGLVETCSPADLGIEGDSLVDTEPGGLVLGAERVRGQVIGGGMEDAAGAVLEMLRSQRLVGSVAGRTSN